jgi:hypothetical protein
MAAMSTSIPLAAVVPPRRRTGRYFYPVVALVVIAIVGFGFARSYYLRPLFPNDGELSTLLHVHGVSMSLWFALFFAQAWLVASGRVGLHRQLGWVTAVVAASIIVIGPQVAVATAAAGRAPPGVPPLAFLAVPLGDMAVFTLLFGLAMFWRRQGHLHKRLMLLASLSLLPAAIARFPFGWIQAAGPLAYFGLAVLLICACAVYDTRLHRRLHPVFFWGTLFVVVSQIGRLMVAGTPQWMSFAEWLVG